MPPARVQERLARIADGAHRMEAIGHLHAPAMLALDGERELLVRQGERWEVALSWDGPKVLDVDRTLLLAQQRGLHHG
jgi:hypothetical protein